jgi:hypothetical protein
MRNATNSGVVTHALGPEEDIKYFTASVHHKNAVKRLISMLLRRVLSAFLIREPSSIRSFALNNHQNFICFQLPECDESIRAVSNREHFSSALLLKQVSASLRLALHVISSHCAERAEIVILAGRSDIIEQINAV